MQKNETGLQEKEKTNVLSLIKQLDETILTIKNTKAHLNRNVIALSGTLRENVLSKVAVPKSVIELTLTTQDRYLKAGATLKETLELFHDLKTELKSKI
jgi:hypothetical protein